MYNKDYSNVLTILTALGRKIGDVVIEYGDLANFWQLVCISNETLFADVRDVQKMIVFYDDGTVLDLTDQVLGLGRVSLSIPAHGNRCNIRIEGADFAVFRLCRYADRTRAYVDHNAIITATAIPVSSANAEDWLYGATILESIPSDYFRNYQKTTIYRALSRSGFSYIPSTLLRPLSGVSNLTECFYACPNLDVLPAGFFEGIGSATTTNRMFGYSGLKKIEAGAMTGLRGGCNAQEMFYNCRSLEEIPDDIVSWANDNANIRRMFSGCTSLKHIPELWITSTNTNHGGCFSDCTGADNYAAAVANGWA